MPPVYDDAWEPFWTLAEEVGVPIGFHLAVLVKKTRLDEGSRSAANPVIATASRYAQEPPGIQLLEPMTGLIFSGVLVDKVMVGSDYPHPATTWPHSRQIIEEHMQCMPAAVRQKIVRDNACALFGI
ncbi:MAG: amidohydrolase family protein [Candidatus Binatia bacterium]